MLTTNFNLQRKIAVMRKIKVCFSRKYIYILIIILITQFICDINNEIDVYLTDIAGLETRITDICFGSIVNTDNDIGFMII